MRFVGPISIALLGTYSVWLIDLERRTSQSQVRPYFADIEGNSVFFAINTTISASLLGGAALLMLFAALVGPRGHRGARFLLSQAAMFGFMAADDRFQLHERIGWRLGVSDHYVLLGWCFAEALLLAAFFRPFLLSRRATILFCLAAGLFALMFAIDAFAPGGAPLRLSLEDISKTWATAMLFGFGWEAARFHLDSDHLGATPTPDDPEAAS